jgi:methylenetetrahydrofolate dehydrogenase (NADP+)/methenyltetrahydrofolate cyclohydrolase
MKIDGRKIAEEIFLRLKKTRMKANLPPTLLVILVGDNPASISYIRQKEKAAQELGFKIIIKKFSDSITQEKLKKEIGEANKNYLIHGVIVQLPLPKYLDPNHILSFIAPSKDVDGFTPNSFFKPPVAEAVLKILAKIHAQGQTSCVKNQAQGQTSSTVVIGRGMTAGKPIAETLKKLGYKVAIAHSQTTPAQFSRFVKSAGVVISCVGKENIVKAQDIKPGAIVIGVGLHRTPEGKLAGDFDEEEISRVAGFYTPTPGGIGPVNVACLMENLARAYQNLTV